MRAMPNEPKTIAAELITPRDFLRYAVSRFNAAELVYGHGTTNAFDDAAFLILESLKLPIDQLEPWLDARLLPHERLRLATLIEARVTTRKPSVYLVGKAYIQGVPFTVDERVIVPRSYIGEMLMGDRLIAPDGIIDDPGAICRVLDLCTGSACLAILATMRFPEAMIDAVELSRDALEARVRLLQGDLFAPIGEETYDLIIANPPYVAREVVEAFPAEYAVEPQMAHLGGDDGLDLVRQIIEGAAKHLSKNGALLCEIGEDRHILEADYPQLPFLWLDSMESSGEVFWISRKGLEKGLKR
jgi:ribosomal protein L3 glutamine methyltransferase